MRSSNRTVFSCRLPHECVSINKMVLKELLGPQLLNVCPSIKLISKKASGGNKTILLAHLPCAFFTQYIKDTFSVRQRYNKFKSNFTVVGNYNSYIIYKEKLF